jgi:PAS domain S-box-containing protein
MTACLTLAPTMALSDLVNELTRELAEARRTLAMATQKLGTNSRALEARTQELTEARAALALLLATLDASTDGILAMGHFGRAMHYNQRFIELWAIDAGKLAALSESSLLAMQLARVRDPEAFLARAAQRKAQPDAAQSTLVDMMDGRILEMQVLPQRVRGKRVGTVTCVRDVTERERLGRVVATLESDMPDAVAEARATVF